MKNNATRLLIITGLMSFLIGGIFGYMIRSKVEPTRSARLAWGSDLGFDWYLGSLLMNGADSNTLTKAKVEPTGSTRLARRSDVGFDWYLGSLLMNGADSNTVNKAMAEDVSK